MKILIDGYNVLKAIEPGKYITDQEREKFVNQLARYGKRKGHTLILVFDGGFMSMQETLRIGPVHVMYVGHKRTADEYIMQYLDRHRSEQLLLISNDRELIDHASHYDMPHIGAMTFYNYVQAESPKHKERVKKSGDTHKLVTTPLMPELDQLMEEAVVLQLPDENDTQEPRTSSVRTRSKKQRRMDQILKKL